MYVAYHIIVRNNPRAHGWMVYHLRRRVGDNDIPYQSTPLGFLPMAGEDDWTDARKHLRGLTALGDVNIPPAEWPVFATRTESPEHMHRMAMAIEGN